MMKYLITLTLTLLLLTTLGCQNAQNPSAVAMTSESTFDSDNPKIVFASTEHDFGEIKAASEQSCVFEFINDGGKDLVIENIHASCGCTTTSMSNTTIKSGQASEIEATYQAPSFAGISRKQIIVYTNDPENPEVSLWITAETIDSAEANSPHPATAPKQTQPPKDAMPSELKQFLRNLNKATG